MAKGHNPRPARERSKETGSSARAGRSPAQIAEGVRRQREHIMMLDGADPLRGGVAD